MRTVINPSRGTGPTETPHFLKREPKKKQRKTKQNHPQDICMQTHSRACPKQDSPPASENPRLPARAACPTLSPCFLHQLFTRFSFHRLKRESLPISVHYCSIKVITNPVAVSNMYHIRVLTLRHPGCMISLQMEHSISMRLNLLSSSSTVSSFPASPHTRHTAVWGNTGCVHTAERSLGQDTEDIRKRKNSTCIYSTLNSKRR